MFDATLKDRKQSFDSAPGTTMFLHWLVGMVYVFYFASFILLLREVSGGLGHVLQLVLTVKPLLYLMKCFDISLWLQVLRPGVLWFLRNLNDPDFNPVQEMIHLPIYRHLRRFILSVVSVVSSCSAHSQTYFGLTRTRSMFTLICCNRVEHFQHKIFKIKNGISRSYLYNI